MNRDATADTMRRERRYGYIYLVNLIIPVSFLSLFPLQRALVGAVMLVVFTSVYLLTFKSKRWKLTLVILQVLIMMVMMSYLNGAYIWMIFYPAACIAIFFERRHVLFMVGSMTIILVSENYVLSLFHRYALGDWLMVLAAVVAGVATCYGTIWQTQTIRSREQLRNANVQIERLTKIAERERISRDLHDVMGHELSMITLKSQLAYKLMDRDCDRAKSEIRDIEHAARQALTRVREYIAGIRQANIEEEWDDAIKLLGAAGIACEADFPSIGRIASETSMQVAAMCLREAITNLVRYSGARHCLLRMQLEDGTLRTTICDNGAGIIPISQDATHNGNGINGMRARVASVGGRLILWSNGKSIGQTAPEVENPSPWKKGVAILIEVPSETANNTEKVGQ